MFGLGIGEIVLILLVALLVFGPTKLPDMARTFGKAMAEFKKASKDLRDTFEVEMHRMDQASQPQARPEPKILDAEVETIHRGQAVSPVQAPVVASPALAETTASAAPAGGIHSVFAGMGAAMNPPEPAPPVPGTVPQGAPVAPETKPQDGSGSHG